MFRLRTPGVFGIFLQICVYRGHEWDISRDILKEFLENLNWKTTIWSTYGFSCGFLDSSGSYNPSSLFSRVIWTLPNIALWVPVYFSISSWTKPSSDNCFRHQSMSITEYHYTELHIHTHMYTHINAPVLVGSMPLVVGSLLGLWAIWYLVSFPQGSFRLDFPWWQGASSWHRINKPWLIGAYWEWTNNHGASMFLT